MSARLNAEVRKILAMPEIAKKITDLGGEVRTQNSSEEFGVWMTQAIAQWGEIVKEEGIQLD